MSNPTDQAERLVTVVRDQLSSLSDGDEYDRLLYAAKDGRRLLDVALELINKEQ